jgi:NDP-sugar pyrophosphorylase family protein
MINSINCAIIFCGGKGSRLGLVGKKKNKSLLLVRGRPIIYYIIKQVLKTRINKIILPLGYKGNDIKKYIKKTFVKNISKFFFVNTGLDTEISERIVKIKHHLLLGGSTFLMNGDTIFDFNLESFFNSHLRNKKKISLATFSPKVDLGLIKIKNKKPLEFSKSFFISDFQVNKAKYLAYSGLIILESRYLKNFQFSLKKDFELDMYNRCIKSKNVNIFEINKGICFPIDNVKNLNYANNLLILKN